MWYEVRVLLFFFLHVTILSSPNTIHWEDYFFPHWVVLETLSKEIDHKHMGIILDSKFNSIDFYVYPYACTTLSWSLWLMVSFATGNLNYTTLFIYLFEIVLAILGPLQFCINFKFSVSFSTKKPAMILIGNAFICKSIWGVLPSWQY